MLVRSAAVLSIGLVAACARKHPRIYEPTPPPDTSVAETEPPVTADVPPPVAPPPAPAEPVKLPASLIVYSQFHYKDKSLLTSGPVKAIAPTDVKTEVTLVDGNSRDIKVTNHVVAGLGEESRQYWVMAIRSSSIASVPSSVDGLTSDDRVVSRCKGGVGEAFELCTYDAAAGAKRVVMHEPAAADDAAMVAGAGGTRVLIRYASNSKPPFAYDLANDTRRELKGLAKPSKSVERSIISPSGALAARCYLANAKATLVIADLTGAAPDKTVPIGDLLRCDCKFSPDDKAIACGVLPNKREYFSKPDRLLAIDLASGKQSIISETVTNFVFSPDGHEIAHVSNAMGGKGLALHITPATGGSTREIAPWSVDRPLLGWIAP